jgi:hypothetical protein
MMPLVKGDRKPVRSNHFLPLKAKEEATFVEWFMSFINKSDLQKYLADPNSVRPDAVSPDSRYLISNIWARNRAAIDAKIGRHFVTGVTLFSGVKDSGQERDLFFTDHSEYVLIIEKKNQMASLDKLQNGESRPQVLRFLNSSLKRKLQALGYTEIGRNKRYYNKELTQRVAVGDFAYLVHMGYKTSYDVYEGGLRLLIDYATRIIHESSVWEDVGYYRKQRQMSDEQILEEFIIGKSVWTAYGSQKSYKIDKVLKDKTIDSPFPNPEFKSFKDYFSTKYKVKLNDPKQWLLVHVQTIKDRDPTGKVIAERTLDHIFPAELVRSTGIPEEERGDYRVMKAFAELTCLPPDKRFYKINQFLELLNKPDNVKGSDLKESKPYQLKIDPKSNVIEGCFLPKPRIMTKPNFGFIPPRDRIDLKSLFNQHPLTKWAIVYDKFSDRNLDTIIENLMSSCGRFSITVEPPATFLLPHSGSPTELENIMKKSKGSSLPDIILFVIGKRGSGKIYKAMKTHFTGKGIPLQFFVSFDPKRDTKANSKYSNLVLQMVNKMGANLWVIDRSMEGVLVTGVMVANARKGQAIVTVSGQFGKNFSLIHSPVKIIPSQSKIDVGKAVGELLVYQVNQFKAKTGKLPKTVVVYRQGTSEGQLDQITRDEVQRIVGDFDSKFKNQKPQLVISVVTKRLDDRFAEEFNGRYENPGCGLIIDSGVVKEDHANFFMCAQFVNQGTANPTHYSVIYNDTKSPKMSLGELQTLTYELCWSYTNWMGPIKVPSPLQYATKLSALKAITVSQDVAEQLQFLPYFL